MTARIQGHAKFRDGFGGESSRLVFLPRNRLWGASLAVLAMAAASPASAANFNVTTEAELRSAIDAANANADATDTITLLNDVVISDPTAFPTLTNPVTINTGAFTLSGADTATGITPGTSLSFGGGNLTVTGNAQGGDSAPDAGTVVGGTGISGNGTTITVTNGSTVAGGAGGGDLGLNPAGRGGIGLNLLNGTLLNNGTIIGGAGGISAGNEDNSASGGTGAVLDGGTGHVNNGIIRGGTTIGVLGSAQGLALRNGTLVNNGTIQGGTVIQGVTPAGSTNSDGAYLQGNATIINNSGGVIKGADSTGGRGGDGITLLNANNTIINHGTIVGGAPDTFGIVSFFGASNTTIINSGTIQGDGIGPGTNTAIATITSRLTLELQAGSTIIGDVIARGGVGDILRLGGDEDDSFDVSAIGSAVQYRNFNIFEKTGASTWTITGQGTNQVAPWDIYAGTLLMSEGSDLGDGAVNLIGGTLAGVGTVGSTTAAAGTVISPGIPGVNNGIGTLTIDGDYAGNGGLLDIQTVLGDDSSLTDLLQINGNTSGNTFVQVTNVGGGGGQTVEGIKIVNVDGLTSAGTFDLLGDYEVNGEQAVVAGAYAYGLYQGSVSVPDDGDWYLRNILADDGTPLFQPAAPLYEAYAGTLQAFNQLGTLQQRVGNRSWAGAMGLEQGADAVTDLTGGEPRNSGLWARIEGSDGHFEPETTTSGTDYDTSLWRLQVGLDMQLAENENGTLIGGVNAFYGSIDSDVESPSGTGSIDSDGYGVGGTLTWYGNSGFYVDGQAQATWYDSDVTSDQLGALIEENDGTGYGLSIEAGRKFAIAPNWSTTPQAQLVWSSVDFDGFADGFGTDVSLNDSDSLVGRLGITADYEAFGQDASGRVTRSHFYGIGNLYYDFEDGSTVDVAGVELTSENESLWGGLGIGGTYNWADDKYSVYGEALVKTGLENFGDSHVLYGTVGFRASW